MTGRGYLVLLSAQAAGEAIHAMTGLPLSGPIIGMVLLLIVFWVRRGPSRELRASANGLLGYLSLLFVPAAVGIMPLLPLLRAEWLPIAVALAASSVMAMASTALIAQAMSRRRKASAQHRLAAEPLRLAEGGP
jgi:holin-like protein